MRPRVLIIFPGALGDLICLLPAIAALARRYGGCDLELMARAELADFASGRIGIVRGHSIDRREVSLLFSPADDASARAREFFGAFSRIHSFFGADDPRCREVLAASASGETFFHPFRPEANCHISAAYLEALGEPHNETEIVNHIELTDADVREAENVAAACGADRRRFVLLMPGSGSRTKNWPVRCYVELGRKLAQSEAVIVVLGPAELHLKSAFSDFKTVIQPPLGVLAGLVRMARAFVANDSGIAHLAAAAGAPGVVIFGPTDPARWRPLGRVIVLHRMPLADLPWQEVDEALAGLL